MSEKDIEAIKEEVPEENPEPMSTRPPGIGDGYCPLCGGPVKQTWHDVSTLVFATFFGTLMLAPLLLAIAMGGGGPVFAILGLVSGAIALLSLWVLPVTGAIAVVARPRCRSCGHSLLPTPDDSHPSLEASFPVWPAVISSLTLLAILVIGLVWFRWAPGQEAGTVGLTFFLRIVMAGFALSFGLLAQTLLWRRLGTRVTNAVGQGLLLLLPTIVLGLGWLMLTGYDHWTLSRKYDPVTRAPHVLDRAGLAALPTSARQVRVYSWAFMLSGEFALRFAADPNVIEQFLADSPSLEGVTHRTYSAEGMRLPARSDDDIFAYVFDDGRAGGHEYFDPNRNVLPDWYQKSIRGPGRRYEVSWYDGKYQGELIVDDEDHTVYVHVSRF